MSSAHEIRRYAFQRFVGPRLYAGEEEVVARPSALRCRTTSVQIARYCRGWNLRVRQPADTAFDNAEFLPRRRVEVFFAHGPDLEFAAG